jgi:hypothetical protein
VINVAVSQLVPYIYISSSRVHAEAALNQLIALMVANCVPRPRLLRRLRGFLDSQALNLPGLHFDPAEIRFL